jgi:hypothetical protein
MGISLVAVILGHISLGQIQRSNGAETGRGLAIVGLVLGYGGLVATGLLVLIATGNYTP